MHNKVLSLSLKFFLLLTSLALLLTCLQS